MSVKIIFFDLGNTLGQASFRRHPLIFSSLMFFPLSAILRLGIISNTSIDSGAHVDSALGRVGILDHFDPALRIYSQDIGLKKDIRTESARIL
jgi:FMN phosphatase YigB (HAD superfamily)